MSEAEQIHLLEEAKYEMRGEIARLRNANAALVAAVFRARGDLKEIGLMIDHGEHKSAARLALDAWDHINRAWQEAGRLALNPRGDGGADNG